MARAALAIARGKQLQGGSTITQQYVKIMYLNQERTMSRKLDELFIATKMSRTQDKKTILENYLNTIYFGEGAYGIRAAGQVYFGVDHPKDLTVPQAAYLATVLNNPTRFDSDNPAAAGRTLSRYRYVLSGMAELSTITAGQNAQYRRSLPPLKKRPKGNRYSGPAGYLLDLARRELARYGFDGDRLSGGGLRVITTFDHTLQQRAIAATYPSSDPALHVALASVRPRTGEVVALVGGRDYLKNQQNWATTLAADGSRVRPHVIKEVRDSDGKVLWSAEPKPVQAIDQKIARYVFEALMGGKGGSATGLSIEKRRFNKKCRCKKYKGGKDTLASWWVSSSADLSTAVLYRAGKEGESALYGIDESRPGRVWAAYVGPRLVRRAEPLEPQR